MLGLGNIEYTISAQALYSLVFSENRNFMFWTSIFYEHFHFNCSMLWTRTACSLWTVSNDMANAHMHTVTRTCQLSPRRLDYLLIQEIEYGICIKWHTIIFRLFFFYLCFELQFTMSIWNIKYSDKDLPVINRVLIVLFRLYINFKSFCRYLCPSLT